jgi:hypothetical protein
MLRVKKGVREMVEGSHTGFEGLPRGIRQALMALLWEPITTMPR